MSLKKERWDGERLSSLRQSELCLLLQSRVDRLVQLKGKNKQSVDTDDVVKTVEILNALLIDQTGVYIATGPNEYIATGPNEYIARIEIVKK